jgi:hypothetical protein
MPIRHTDKNFGTIITWLPTSTPLNRSILTDPGNIKSPFEEGGFSGA